MKFLRKPLCTTFHFLIFRVFHSIHLSLCWLFFSTFSLPLSSVSLICFLHSLLLSLPQSYSPSLPVTGLSTSFTTSILFSLTSSHRTLYFFHYLHPILLNFQSLNSLRHPTLIPVLILFYPNCSTDWLIMIPSYHRKIYSRMSSLRSSQFHWFQIWKSFRFFPYPSCTSYYYSLLLQLIFFRSLTDAQINWTAAQIWILIREETCHYCLSDSLSVCLPVRLSICLTVCHVWLSVCLRVYLCVCLSVCLSVSLSAYLTLSMSVYPLVCLTDCLSTCEFTTLTSSLTLISSDYNYRLLSTSYRICWSITATCSLQTTLPT